MPEAGKLDKSRIYFSSILKAYWFSQEATGEIVTPVTHRYFTRNAVSVGLQAPRVVKSYNYTNPYYIANFLLRNIPQHIRDLQVPLSAYKNRVSVWLLEVGAEHADGPNIRGRRGEVPGRTARGNRVNVSRKTTTASIPAAAPHLSKEWRQMTVDQEKLVDVDARSAWLLLGWVTAKRSCPCKQPACPAIGGGSEITFKPLVPRDNVESRSRKRWRGSYPTACSATRPERQGYVRRLPGSTDSENLAISAGFASLRDPLYMIGAEGMPHNGLPVYHRDAQFAIRPVIGKPSSVQLVEPYMSDVRDGPAAPGVPAIGSGRTSSRRRCFFPLSGCETIRDLHFGTSPTQSVSGDISRPHYCILGK
ncbi:hypothetical protein J6590_034842 [Homalodisca vitripennis]|nr:hypothetical protein J6590_034842 [Homalodisca vitripennis]